MTDIDWNKIFEGLPNETGKIDRDMGMQIFSQMMKRVTKHSPDLDSLDFNWDQFIENLRTADRLEMLELAKRYGPFRLHTWAIVHKDGNVAIQPSYYMLVGEPDIPIVVQIGGKSPTSISELFGGCVAVGGAIPVEQSALRDVTLIIKKQLVIWQASIEYDEEQITMRPQIAEGRRRILDQTKRSYDIVRASLRELEMQYAHEIATLDVAMDREEIERERIMLRRRRQIMDSFFNWPSSQAPTGDAKP